MESVWNLGSRSSALSEAWSSAFFLVRSSCEQCASPGVYEPGMDVARRERLVLHAGDQELAIGADALDPHRSQGRCGTAPCSLAGSAERRVGKEWVSTGLSRGWPY